MTLPALTNATLTKVEAVGFRSDYDEPATVGAVKWTGAQPVFWSEMIEEFTVGQRPTVERGRVHGMDDVFVHRYLVVDIALAVLWEIDDTVTVTSDSVTKTGIVQAVNTSRGPGFGVVRLVLTDA